MKKLLIIFFALILFAAVSWCVPKYLNYSGVLKNSAGEAQTGTFTLRFKIYDALTGGNLVFDSGETSVTVTSGLYNVALGSLDHTHFTGADRWIETVVGSDTLTPRLKINSVAYCIYASSAESASVAGNANTVDDFSASSTATANALFPLDASARISGVAITAESTSGNALTIKGKLAASTGSGYCAGTGQIDSGGTGVNVTNTALTSSSLIFLSAGHAASAASANTNGGIRVSAVNTTTNRITVSTMDGNPASANIPFCYMIIN